MTKSLRTRLMMIFAGMLILSFVSIFVLSMFLLPYAYESSKENQMASMYEQAVKACESKKLSNLSNAEEKDLYDALDIINESSTIHLYIMKIEAYEQSGDIANITYIYPDYDPYLQRVTENQVGKYVKAKYFNVPLDPSCKAIEKNSNYSIYKVYDERVKAYYFELTGKVQGDYWIFMRMNFQSIDEASAVSTVLSAQIGVVLVIIGLIIMYFVGRKFTKPILMLANQAKEMQKLDFSHKYEVKRKDEIGVLGESMNLLTETLEKKITELKIANNELEKDVERKTKNEQMRQEFISNVSHELKTPIALIQGYAEGLQDCINDDQESREFYCEVIIDEANKMNSMVKRLLSLNQVESGSEPLDISYFSLGELVEGIVNSREIIAKEKNVSLTFVKGDEDIKVWADEYMIEEVITNYISNAFNHVMGEKRIEVKIEKKEDVAKLSVFNTGNQIPEDDIDKIWQKFYKVDKAHSREYGGNGIGLSIVKAIMDSHKQKYGVKNYDNGVEFWIELDMKNFD